MEKQGVRDLLYFDLDKAASLWSQLAGGLRERVSSTAEQQSDTNNGMTFGIPRLFEAKFGGTDAEKQSTLESRILHHDLLNMLEEGLTRCGLVIDLHQHVDALEASADTIRNAIGKKPYVIAHGWSAIEDYQRIHAIAGRFGPIVEFVGTCMAQGRPDVKQLLKTRAEKQVALSKETEKNKKARIAYEIQKIQEKISAVISTAIQSPDLWLLDGIRLWIDTFMRNRINFRVFPFENCPSFQFLCNLKRECFVDQDLEHLLYGYGNRPTVRLAVFGLITSIPPKSGETFDPLKEFESFADLMEKVAFEKAFRDIFSAMEVFESLVRFSRYPNISVHPIAVFRQFDAIPETRNRGNT